MSDNSSTRPALPETVDIGKTEQLRITTADPAVRGVSTPARTPRPNPRRPLEHAGSMLAISRAVQPNLVSGFDDSFRRHLAVEQRRAVLDTIARELAPDTTLGDIVDAAQDLGWAENLGELSLADLALALLGEAPASAPARAVVPKISDEDSDEDHDSDDDEDEDEDDEDEEAEEEAEEEAAPAAKRGRKVAKTETRKPTSLDRALERIDKALAARGRKALAEPRGTGKLAKAKVGKSKKAAKKAATPIKRPSAASAAAAAAFAAAAAAAFADDDDTDAMSLDQAARLLVPLVRKLREATMQNLEEQTHMGRRKLRFHIGQLVKHGKLRRHGMGRGTCYTVK